LTEDSLNAMTQLSHFSLPQIADDPNSESNVRLPQALPACVMDLIQHNAKVGRFRKSFQCPANIVNRRLV
jgi:hypothetical protein